MLEVQNLSDETVEIERAGVVTFAENPGTAVALKVKYDFFVRRYRNTQRLRVGLKTRQQAQKTPLTVNRLRGFLL